VGIEDELLDTTEAPKNFILSGGVAVVTKPFSKATHSGAMRP
jgi:hypothetical protein